MRASGGPWCGRGVYSVEPCERPGTHVEPAGGVLPLRAADILALVSAECVLPVLAAAILALVSAV
jgi:hypothetical protein